MMRSRRRGRLTITATIVILATSALSACSAPHLTTPPLHVAVFQLRSDYAVRGAQIEVTNSGKLDLTITSATFSSGWFAGTVASPAAPNPLLAGATIDFRVALGEPRCDVATASPLVRLGYTRSDGSRGHQTVRPAVPFDSIATVHAQDCAQARFEKVAAISVAPALRFETTGSTSAHAALLDVTLTPTGAPGSVTLESTADTTLLAQREGPLRSIALTLTAASAPTTITLDYVPASCLEHRVAEDKIGSLIPMRVDVGDSHNVLFLLAVSASLKSQLLDWVGIYCGWAGASR